MDISLSILIAWAPALVALICGICMYRPTLRSLAAPYCIIGIAVGFVVTMVISGGVEPVKMVMENGVAVFPTAEQLRDKHVVDLFTWIAVGDFSVPLGYWIDPLTIVMLIVVTGVGTLVATYAVGYMRGDPGFGRFFMAVALFIFAMNTLVMADNLVLMYLGWEGVGLCSYLLIGYYYGKDSAVAAAKKAFIVNRVGDLGFALGIFLTYQQFGSVEFADLYPAMNEMAAGGEVPFAVQLIPFLLMLGAFGKSAQLPLHVWLPDAMEGPTPVSALIHAATMVTAGVYMIVRLLPLFALSPYALPTVATVGGITAIFAGTIALCQNDLKKVYAYSTVSQLGYMFLGVGALSLATFGAFGAIFHLFTHAFFKALLFLTAGSVMHALAGQLDMRTMSGLVRKMPVTCWLMFVGCLALAGFPFLSGFYSKDTILADAMAMGLEGNSWYFVLVTLGLVTALVTAFYTFRLWFRVFMGPLAFEMGDEHHGPPEDGDGEDEHHHAPAEPHEMPWWPMNAPLVVLAVGAIIAGIVGYAPLKEAVKGSTAGLAPHMVAQLDHHAGDTQYSTAVPEQDFEIVLAADGEGAADGGEGKDAHAVHHYILGLDLHLFMQLLSGLIALVGIGAAAHFFWFHRDKAERLAEKFGPIPTILENKYYVDEIYHAAIRLPLYVSGQVFFVIDRFLIDGMVQLVGFVPRLMGRGLQPVQHGRLQGYGLAMGFGLAAILILLIWAVV